MNKLCICIYVPFCNMYFGIGVQVFASTTQPLYFPNPGPSRLVPHSPEEQTKEKIESPIPLAPETPTPLAPLVPEMRFNRWEIGGRVYTGFQQAPLNSGILKQELSGGVLETGYHLGIKTCWMGGLEGHSANPFPNALGHKSQLIWPQIHLGIKTIWESMAFQTLGTWVGHGNLRSRGMLGSWGLGVKAPQDHWVSATVVGRRDFLQKSSWFAGKGNKHQQVWMVQPMWVMGVKLETLWPTPLFQVKMGLIGIYQNPSHSAAAQEGGVLVLPPTWNGGVEASASGKWGTWQWDATLSKGCSSHSIGPAPTAAVCYSTALSLIIGLTKPWVN